MQRDILQQIEELQARLGFSILFITHDLSLLIEISTRIAIMYAGRMVELTTGEDLLRRPLHPYTVGLMSSFPAITGPVHKLEGIPGSPPDLISPPTGCRFHPRCPHCTTGTRLESPELYRRQTEVQPELREIESGHFVACHLYEL